MFRLPLTCVLEQKYKYIWKLSLLIECLEYSEVWVFIYCTKITVLQITDLFISSLHYITVHFTDRFVKGLYNVPPLIQALLEAGAIKPVSGHFQCNNKYVPYMRINVTSKKLSVMQTHCSSVLLNKDCFHTE